MRIEVASVLPASQQTVLELLKTKQTLVYISRPLVVFEEGEKWWGEWMLNETYNLRPRQFGILPATDHFVTFTRIDLENGVLKTREQGGPITRWDHLMHVKAVDSKRSKYTDTIEVEGNVPDWYLKLFVSQLYRHRHRRWKKLLKLSEKGALPSVFL